MLKNPKLLKFLIVSSIISLAIAYPIYKTIKEVSVGSGLLMLTGFGLLVTSYFHNSRKSFNLNFDKGMFRISLVAGILQGLAVIPGLSRSGSTIFGLSLGNFSPRQILKISYMMSAPIIIVSSIFLIISDPLLIEGWPSLITSFLIGIISLNFIMRISEKINFSVFALIFAIFCFIGAGIGFYSGL